MKNKNRPSSSNQEEKTTEQIAQEQATSEYHRAIKGYLDRPKPAVSCAEAKLDEIKDKDYLDIYLKKTNYKIFQWILGRDNLQTLRDLTNLISKQRASWMVTHDDYSAIKDYVSNILQLNPEAYEEAKPVKYAILKAVISFKFNSATNPIYDLIKAISEKNKKSKIEKTFLEDIEKIVNELKIESDCPMESTPTTQNHKSTTTTQEITQKNGNQTTPASCMPSAKPQPIRRSVRQKNRKEQLTDNPQQIKPVVIENRKRKRPVDTAIQKNTQNHNKTTPASCMSSHGLLAQKRVRFNDQEKENSKRHTNSARQSKRTVKGSAP